MTGKSGYEPSIAYLSGMVSFEVFVRGSSRGSQVFLEKTS
jgi:hypothetical protein